MRIKDKALATCQSLFNSFWLAGFESACHINKAGTRLDMLSLTQHDQQVADDYQRLLDIGIGAVRDGIRWHLIERSGKYDFSSLAPMVEAAQRTGMQVIWNICHYGWPDDLDLHSPQFITRYERFCRAVARFMKEHTDGVPFYVPMNEISFFSWAAGDVAYIYPFGYGRGKELKYHLIRAAIAGCEALWSMDPRARIVNIEPLIHVVAPRNHPELADEAAAQTASQFEAWDVLSGRYAPEIGGHPKYLDIIGVNYYHANQWEYPDQRLRWEDTPRDERFVLLRDLLAEVSQRYQRPMFIAETSHFGVGRGPWLAEIAQEVQAAQNNGVPIKGICIYPILDRQDWDDLNAWHNSGLWDLQPDGHGKLVRVLNQPYAATLLALIQECRQTT